MKQQYAWSIRAAFLLSATSLLFGADPQPLQTSWERVCAVSNGQQLVLTKDNGEAIEGYCVSIDVNTIAVRTAEQQVVIVSRKALSKLQMRRPRANQLASLGRGMHRQLKEGAKLVFSPLAPAGLVMVPVTLAWGAVATPFCILGDLFGPKGQTREIRLSARSAYSH